MELRDQIARWFEESLETKSRVAPMLVEPIARAAECMSDAMSAGGKVLACGNGGSAGDSQHFAAELIGHFGADRSGLPAIALSADVATLTALANDHGWESVFSRQIDALGRPGDVLLAITTSGKSANVLEAIRAAQRGELRVVLLSGRDGAAAAAQLRSEDSEIRIPSDSTARIQEVHLLVIHCLCQAIGMTVGNHESRSGRTKP